MLQTTLIKPPTVVNVSSLSYYNSVPSIGLAYIAATAKLAGHQIQVIDAVGEAIENYSPLKSEQVKNLYIHGLTPPEIVERINPKSQVIGIANIFLHEWPIIKNLLHLIKQKFPHMITVLGGETPTAFWWQMMKESEDLDICVLGEGDLTFQTLLEVIENDQSFDEIPGITYRNENGELISSENKQSRIRAIDEVPWPDWEAFHVEAYLDAEYSSGVKRGRSLPMVSSRGCPYQCTFCSSPGMWTTRYVTRDPELVADEIEHYVKRYGINNIDFNDLTSMLTKTWILKFCDAIERRKLNISWQLPSGTRCEALDRDSLKALYRSGCRNLSYSPESGSPRLLKETKKLVKIDVLLKSARAAVEENIVVGSCFIVGLPGEKWIDILYSYWLIIKLAAVGIQSVSVMIFAPYPGSTLFKKLFEEGRIQTNERYYYSSLVRSGKSTISYNGDFQSKTLLMIQMVFLCTFYGLQYLFRPQRLFRTLYKVMTKASQENVMEKFLTTKLFYLHKLKEIKKTKVQTIDLT